MSLEMLPAHDPRIIALEQSLRRGAENGSLCISGGAKGCDILWGAGAVAADMKAVHWSFRGHRTPLVEEIHGRACRLSAETMELAAPAMTEVARHIQRRLSIKPGVRPLLLRDLFQVAWSNSVYAVSSLDDTGNVKGGTAWAVGAFRLFGDGPVHLFCQNRNQWFSCMDHEDWKMVSEEDVPIPEGIWTGIGTSEPNDAGRSAIQRISARMRPSPCFAP